LLLAAVVAVSVTPVTVLAIRGENRCVLIEITEGEVLECYFVHSVELSPVIEIYRVEANRLILVESRMKTFGWGLPSNEPGFSVKDIEGKGWFAFSMARLIGDLVIAADPVNDYTFTAAGQQFKLIDFGRRVKISVERQNLLGVMIGRCPM
jgi:hypothetical protein